jgi:ketosteroid isomerase-like protein
VVRVEDVIVSVIAGSSVPETLVSAWLGAFNAGDLDRMLACAVPDVYFQPLRLVGLDGSYHGHDGVRRWVAQLRALRVEQRIDLSDLSCVGDGQVLAAGTVRLAGRAEVSPFRALHRIGGELIIAAHHYVSDPGLLERLGLVR